MDKRSALKKANVVAGFGLPISAKKTAGSATQQVDGIGSSEEDYRGIIWWSKHQPIYQSIGVFGFIEMNEYKDAAGRL